MTVFVASQGPYYEREIVDVYATLEAAIKDGWKISDLEEFEVKC